MPAGIIDLAALVVSEIDDDNDFAGTTYTGPTIISASVISIGKTQKKKSAASPKLLRKRITIEFLRLRVGSGDPHISDLLYAFTEKLKANLDIKEVFGERIVMDDADEPQIDGLTSHKPYLLVDDFDLEAEMQFSDQREESIKVDVWIFTQQFPKTSREQRIGDAA